MTETLRGCWRSRPLLSHSLFLLSRCGLACSARTARFLWWRCILCIWCQSLQTPYPAIATIFVSGTIPLDLRYDVMEDYPEGQTLLLPTSVSHYSVTAWEKLPDSDHSPFPSSNHISISPISSSPCHRPTNSFPSIKFLTFSLTPNTKFGAEGVPFFFSLSFLGVVGSYTISLSPNTACISPGYTPTHE